MKKTAHAIGKRIGAYLYIHRLALPFLEETQAQHVTEALAACPEAACACVFKIDEGDRVVSALDYPAFFESPFPELRQAWHIPLNGGLTSQGLRTYFACTRKPSMLTPFRNAHSRSARLRQH
jgi:hypothetical protein